MPAALVPWIHWLGFSAAARLPVNAAAHDLAVRTIPRTILARIAILSVTARITRHDLPVASLAMAVFSTGGDVACWHSWSGGGDLKLPVVFASLVPLDRVLPVVTGVAGCGAVLARPYAALRRQVAGLSLRRWLVGLFRRPLVVSLRRWFVGSSLRRPPGLPICDRRAERCRPRRSGQLPYGLAIAADGIPEVLEP